ncbi:MAG TPA: CDP-alcohol phosphatidyltransferase family protein [Terriglobales bacterium]|nr:CDP-alcohol phosphatidyltransferase family protein [Terriglobales bacterium]
MLDARLRRMLAPGLSSVAHRLEPLGLRPNQLSVWGAVAGLAAGVAIAADGLGLALALAVLSRIADGLDGPLARLHGSSDFGGYLDIVADFVFYTAVPLGFASRDPAAAALPTAFLLAGYVFTGVTFLAYSAVAERRHVEEGDGRSFIFQPGLTEGTETLIAYALMFAMPEQYAPIAWGYAALCFYTALSRSILASRVFHS